MLDNIHICFACGYLAPPGRTCPRCKQADVEHVTHFTEMEPEPGWWFPMVGWCSAAFAVAIGAAVAIQLALRYSAANSNQSSAVTALAILLSVVALFCLQEGLRWGFQRGHKARAQRQGNSELRIYTWGSRIVRVCRRDLKPVDAARLLGGLRAIPSGFISLSLGDMIVQRLNQDDVLAALGHVAVGPWREQRLSALRFTLFVALLQLVADERARIWRETVSTLRWYSHIGKVNVRPLRSTLYILRAGFPPAEGFGHMWWKALPANLSPLIPLSMVFDGVGALLHLAGDTPPLSPREATKLAEQLAASYQNDRDRTLSEITTALHQSNWPDVSS